MSGPKKKELFKGVGHRTATLFMAALLLLSLIWVVPFDARAAGDYDIVVHKVVNLLKLEKDDSKSDDMLTYNADMSIDQFKEQNREISLGTGDFCLFSVNEDLIQKLDPASLGLEKSDPENEDSATETSEKAELQKNKIYGEWIPELINAYLRTKGFDAKLSSKDFASISTLQATLNDLVNKDTPSEEQLPEKDESIVPILKDSATELKELKMYLESLNFSDTDTIPSYWKRVLQEKLLYNLALKSNKLEDGAFAFIAEDKEGKDYSYTFSDLDPNNYIIIDKDGFDLKDPKVHALATILLKNDFYEDLEYKPDEKLVFNTYPKPIFPPDGKTPPEKTDKPHDYDLVLTKTDGNHPLSGAVFYLYHVKKVGNQYKPYDVAQGPETSDAQGHVYFRNLKPGLYSIYESQAPKGYQKIGWLDFSTLGLPGANSVIQITEDTQAPLPGITVVNKPENPPSRETNPPPTSPNKPTPNTPTPTPPPQGNHNTPPGNVPASGGNVPATGESGMLVGKILSLLLLIAAIGLAVQLRRKMRRQETTDTDAKH